MAMREEFRTLEWTEPPMGDLVEDAMAQGRRMRTARRLRVGGGTGLAVLAAAGVLTGLVLTSPHRDTGGLNLTPATVAAAAPSSTTTSPAPTEGPRVKATPAGLLELLLQTLPTGKTSHYAGDHQPDSADITVQTWLDRGHGPGLIRAFVIDSHVQSKETWTPLGDGVDYLVRHVPSNCLQSTIVLVRHPGNLLVQIDLATCLPGSTSGKQPPQVLTVAEAVKIGADPRWGLSIDPALNAEGAHHFPHLSTDFPGE
jgi:hypothetical protein